MIESLLTQPCVLHRRSQGSPDADYNEPTIVDTTTAGVCYAEQLSTLEQETEGDVNTSLWRVFLPAGETVTGLDAIEVGGHTIEVIGDPWPVWDALAGATHHIEVSGRSVR